MRPQRAIEGFVLLTHKPCPDCMDNALGGRRVGLRPSVRPVAAAVRKAFPSALCGICGGSGEIALGPNDPERIDPYARRK